MPKTPKMRTIQQAVAEMKQLDPNTCITTWYIRQLVHSGDLPAIYSGRKTLINFNNLIEYLNGEKGE